MSTGGGQVQTFFGTRSIDDIVLRRMDRLSVGTTGTYEGRWYYLTDAQGSVVSLVRPNGVVEEQLTYSPYGLATYHDPTDFDGDGTAGATPDYFAFYTAWANSDRASDFNRDGVYNSSDFFDYLTEWSTAVNVPGGWIGDASPAGVGSGSAVGPDNPFGYNGYVFNPSTGDYLARYRHYDPTLGRWLKRDPAGYIDGSNLFGYCRGGPVGCSDPMGLSPPGGGIYDFFRDAAEAFAEIGASLRHHNNVYSQVAAEAAFYHAGQLDVAGSTLQGVANFGAELVMHPAGPSAGIVQAAAEALIAPITSGIQREDNIAEMTGMSPVLSDYALSVVSELLGVNSMAAGMANFDTLSMQPVGAWYDRAGMISTGLGQYAGAVSSLGGAATATTEVRYLINTSIDKCRRITVNVDRIETVTVSVSEHAAAKAAGASAASSATSRVSSVRSGGATTGAMHEAFHYTSSRWADNIQQGGLRSGTYATPDGSLSPLQAHLELSLPPTRALPDLRVRVDLQGLRAAGFEIPAVSRVSGTVTGPGGRVYQMPGGGHEMRFPYAVPSNFVEVFPLP